MHSGYDEFEFDLPEALLAKLVAKFDTVAPATLATHIVQNIPPEQGVYQLFLQDGPTTRLVYVGKTDAESGLRDRLSAHARKILHRKGLDPQRVLFKAVRVYVFTAIDLETQLINHYKGVDAYFKDRTWNGSGFGANDPGRERDTTKYGDDHFNTLYEIDIGRALEFAVPTSGKAVQILQTLKDKLPYLIRFERVGKSSKPHADLANTDVTINPLSATSPEAVIASVVGQLPAGWRATMLPSHVILYKNDKKADDYADLARVIGLSPGT